MTGNDSGDQLSTKEAQGQAISEAVNLVNAEIEAVKERLEDIAHTRDASPIMVVGRTSTDCDAEVMVDPSKVARLMLKHEYYLWDTLQQEAPYDMWLDIAAMAGLKRASCVDISLKPKHQNEHQLLEHKN